MNKVTVAMKLNDGDQLLNFDVNLEATCICVSTVERSKLGEVNLILPVVKG